MADDLWDNENHQPSHNQIEGQAEFFIYLLSKNLVEYPKDSRPSLNQDNGIAEPVVHERKNDGCIATCNGNINHGVIDNAKDILLR